MPQDVRQTDDILAGPIERRGEEVAQVVGKDLAPRHPGVLTQGLHLRPNLAAVQGFPASGAKDLPGGDLLFPGVFLQLPEIGRASGRERVWSRV